MPSQAAWRLNLLCEDRRTERFVRGLCERFGIRVLAIDVAPAGKGDASVWVRRKYPDRARKQRSKNFQSHLGLVVVIDGDAEGVEQRKSQLDAELVAEGLAARSPTDPIAVLVPTWSIETWLAALCGREGIDETTPLKLDAGVRSLWTDTTAEADTLKRAVASWRAGPAQLPSVIDAYGEAQRFGI